MHLVLAAADSRDALQQELQQSLPGSRQEIRPGLFACDFAVPEGDRLPFLVFARQLLPDAKAVRAASIRTWATLLVDAVAGILPDEKTWSLHVVPFKELTADSRMGARAWHSRARAQQPRPSSTQEGAQTIGPQRCRLIREATLEILHKRRRHLLRSLRQHEGIFVEDEALVQLVLLSPEQGFLSVVNAPLPFRQQHVVSCFPAGEVPLAVDKQAPSRAFAKLVGPRTRAHSQ